jgi:CRP-like cAMP-binding protein
MDSGRRTDPPVENAVLAALPAAERALVDSRIERIPLGLKHLLQEIDQPVGHLWFLRSGVCSMLAEMADGFIVEVATVGRESAMGLPLILGATRSPQRVIVQIPGEGDRLSARDFQAMRDQLPALNRILLRSALALVSQIAQGSACNRAHPIEARCARWLLLTHDRVDGDSFPLTHEFLAQMLGVARPSVTIAAGILQKAGLIRYTRGVIDILDRKGLEAASCECYALITREFERLLEPEG